MTSSTTALRLRGLVKDHGDFRLGPLDLDLEPGTVLAFIGPNGSGKTTTLHAIMSLLRRDGGEIEVFGIPNDPLHPAWKQDVGFVGEVQGFYRGWTVRRNLDFVGSFYDRWSTERVEDLARRFDLELDQKVGKLSRGGRAKLALVAALGHSPRLLLLDEPTSGLDPVVRAEVLDVLWESLESGEQAILYSTHVLSDIARLADEIAFLRDGILVERTTKDELTESWRRISFRLPGELPELPGLRGTRRSSGTEHQVATVDADATTRRLRELGAENLQVARLTIEEIAVEILKEGHRVAHS